MCLEPVELLTLSLNYKLGVFEIIQKFDIFFSNVETYFCLGRTSFVNINGDKKSERFALSQMLTQLYCCITCLATTFLVCLIIYKIKGFLLS